jgi:CRISPR-associated protein Csb1
MNLSRLEKEPRLLIEASLRPVQGTRFQPTGFPNLGAATYQTTDGTQMMLVESAQSMANRMELVCCDEAGQRLVSVLEGLPYVEAALPDGSKTNSLLEAHRLNSPYIVNSREFDEAIRKEIGFAKNKPFDRLRLAKILFKYDPNSLIHGIFLEKVGGVVRLPRMLSGFIEADNVLAAPSGGVKLDRVQPGTGDNTPYGKAKDGYGNVPFPRDEYTGKIKAYFNLDLALMRGYGLGQNGEKLLIALSLFKIQKFLSDGLRLRTACDLEMADEITVTRPVGFTMPRLEEIMKEIPDLIASIRDFAKPPITAVKYDKTKAKENEEKAD